LPPELGSAHGKALDQAGKEGEAEKKLKGKYSATDRGRPPVKFKKKTKPPGTERGQHLPKPGYSHFRSGGNRVSPTYAKNRGAREIQTFRGRWLSRREAALGIKPYG